MSVFDRIFRRSERTVDAATPKFLKKYTDKGATYEIYRGEDPESAKVFLSKKNVKKGLYYIVVETPGGNWGIDRDGIYLESLVPWQITAINDAKFEGSIINPLYTKSGLEFAAKGINDNFVCLVGCGNCQHQWIDGIRYKALTAVRCPACKSLNKIDSESVQVVFV